MVKAYLIKLPIFSHLTLLWRPWKASFCVISENSSNFKKNGWFGLWWSAVEDFRRNRSRCLHGSYARPLGVGSSTLWLISLYQNPPSSVLTVLTLLICSAMRDRSVILITLLTDLIVKANNLIQLCSGGYLIRNISLLSCFWDKKNIDHDSIIYVNWNPLVFQVGAPGQTSFYQPVTA